MIVEERVAITVWRLATNAEYRTLSELFCVGISTAGTIVNNTCSVIAQHILPRYVQMPSDARLREVVDVYKSKWGFPQVVGAIDGSHIPIIRPSESATDYYNRKCFHSIIQGVVDYRGQFIDVYIGWLGKLHDARVFYNSSFYRKGCQGTLLPSQPIQLEGKDIPLLILGDPAYPLLPWLMNPYSDTATTTPQEKNFNYRQSRARMVVENAFGRLKGRCQRVGIWWFIIMSLMMSGEYSPFSIPVTLSLVLYLVNYRLLTVLIVIIINDRCFVTAATL